MTQTETITEQNTTRVSRAEYSEYDKCVPGVSSAASYPL